MAATNRITNRIWIELPQTFIHVLKFVTLKFSSDFTMKLEFMLSVLWCDQLKSSKKKYRFISDVPFECKLSKNRPTRHTTSFQRRYDVVRPCIDVETTSCVYWGKVLDVRISLWTNDDMFIRRDIFKTLPRI